MCPPQVQQQVSDKPAQTERPLRQRQQQQQQQQTAVPDGERLPLQSASSLERAPGASADGGKQLRSPQHNSRGGGSSGHSSASTSTRSPDLSRRSSYRASLPAMELDNKVGLLFQRQLPKAAHRAAQCSAVLMQWRPAAPAGSMTHDPWSQNVTEMQPADFLPTRAESWSTAPPR